MDSEDNTLGRAHALAARASTLLKGTPSLDDQESAQRASDAAADLFEQARGQANDVGAATTLELLASQNRKQARLLERRVAAGRRAEVVRAGSGGKGAEESQGGAGASSSAGKRDGAGTTAGVHAAGTGTERRRRKAASPTAAARHRTSIPPFATPPPPLAGGSGTIPSIGSSTLGGSSSSSEKIDDSFVVFGSAIDTSDPFARFWNVLETALHDITNPVAFASAPLHAGERRRGGDAGAEGDRADKGKDKGKGREKRSEERGGEPRRGSQEAAPSETDSFYLVGNEVDKQPSLADGAAQAGRKASPPPAIPKTPEELALENTSLRASLDAISKHAHGLELEVRRLRERDERKGVMMKSVVMGVRREAQKAIQSQELYRSQLLQASMVRSGSPASRTTSLRREAERPSIGAVLDSAGENRPKSTAEEAHVAQLEDQIKSLQLENEKQRAHLQKYRERFEKLKTSARSKREARLHAATPLDVVGEENAGEG